MWDRKERPWCRLCTGLLETEAAGHAPYGVRETNDICFMMDISGHCCLVTQVRYSVSLEPMARILKGLELPTQKL